MQAYLDNAATTQIADEAFESMKPFLTTNYGNPSSLHSHGRQARAAIELCRKSVAQLLGASPKEIIFTSGGTEANNTILRSVAKKYGRLITAKTEHHAVLEVAHKLSNEGIDVIYLDIDSLGYPDYDQLETLIKKSPSAVSLMFANNETGTVVDVPMIGKLCSANNSFFHTDAVQAIGHLPINLSTLEIHGLSASAHKFHGPKGTGFMYINKQHRIRPFILGGPQENESRAGTENVAGIVGMVKALELSIDHLEQDIKYVKGLKERFIEKIKSVEGLSFNGDHKNGLYTIVNISIPKTSANELLLFNLDLKGVAASGGSACSAGAVQESHVLKEMGVDPQRGALRFSFSRYNTSDEIDFAISSLRELLD